MTGRWLCAALLGTLISIAPTRGAAITAENFAKAAAYSRSHGGLALRVEQYGRLAFEDYYPGWTASTPHRIFSGTKSFVAVGALVAEEEGLLTLDEPVGRTLSEWSGDRRGGITLDQLLSHTSGLDPGADIIGDAQDQFRAALRVPLRWTPGARFHYGPVGYQAFGEILKRKLRPSGRSVEGFLRREVFRPLGIDIAYWKHDDAGNPLLHAGLWLSSEEWVKFGEFVLDQAVESKKLLVAHHLFTSLFIPHDANPAYGIGFWLNNPPPEPRLEKMSDYEPAIDGEQMYPGGPRIPA